MSEVEYDLKTLLPGGYIHATDVAMVRTRTCTQFKCQKWENGFIVAPKLVKQPSGFWCCPVCRGSYGSQPF